MGVRDNTLEQIKMIAADIAEFNWPTKHLLEKYCKQFDIKISRCEKLIKAARQHLAEAERDGVQIPNPPPAKGKPDTYSERDIPILTPEVEDLGQAFQDVRDSQSMSIEEKRHMLRAIAYGDLKLEVKRPVFNPVTKTFQVATVFIEPDFSTRLDAIREDNKMAGHYIPIPKHTDKQPVSINKNVDRIAAKMWGQMAQNNNLPDPLEGVNFP